MPSKPIVSDQEIEDFARPLVDAALRQYPLSDESDEAKLARYAIYRKTADHVREFYLHWTLRNHNRTQLIVYRLFDEAEAQPKPKAKPERRPEQASYGPDIIPFPGREP